MRRADPLVQPIPTGLAVAIAGASLLLAGCSGRQTTSDPLAGTRLADAPTRTERRADDAPAVVRGTVVPWSAMQPLLAEAAGAEVLQEITLDRALAEEARLRGVSVTDAQIRAEEANLLRTLREAGAALDDAGGRQVLDDLRRRRGLGPRRYEALLRRTALLRAMVQDQIDLTDAAIQRAYELLHGPRYRVRIITVDSIPAANAVQARLDAGEPFGEVAARFSTDPSAGVGGLVEPISAADLNYPSALREALPRLQAGRVSAPIAIERGYAILRLDEVIPADGIAFEDVRDSVEREARIAQERTRMSELAARLIGQSGVTALDPSLAWSWRQGR